VFILSGPTVHSVPPYSVIKMLNVSEIEFYIFFIIKLQKPLDLLANFKPESPARRAAGWAFRQPKEQAYASAYSLYIFHLSSDFFTPTIDKEPKYTNLQLTIN